MAIGDHISHNDNTNQPDNGQKQANDNLFNAAYDNAGANAKVGDKVAAVQAPGDASGIKASDGIKDMSPEVASRMDCSPQAGLAQCNENIGKLLGGLTTKEGQDMAQAAIKEFIQHINPALGDHVNTKQA